MLTEFLQNISQHKQCQRKRHKTLPMCSTLTLKENHYRSRIDTTLTRTLPRHEPVTEVRFFHEQAGGRSFSNSPATSRNPLVMHFIRHIDRRVSANNCNGSTKDLDFRRWTPLRSIYCFCFYLPFSEIWSIFIVNVDRSDVEYSKREWAREWEGEGSEGEGWERREYVYREKMYFSYQFFSSTAWSHAKVWDGATQ